MILSETAFLKGQYPKGTDPNTFKEQVLPKDIWDQIEKDFSEEY